MVATHIHKSTSSGELFYNFYEGSTLLCELSKHVDDWVRIAPAGFTKIIVDVPHWHFGYEQETPHRITACDELVVHTDNERIITYWVQRINGGPKIISIKPQMNLITRKLNKPGHLSREFAQLSVWQNPNLHELVLMHWVPFTDEGFLKLRVKWFEIMSATISENAINQYLHMWVNGALPKAERFGVNFDRLIDQVAVLRGLLVVPWDAEFCEAVPDLAKTDQGGETRYIVFRKLSEDERGEECSFGTVYFHIDNSWYFEVVKVEYEDQVNRTQRERARIAP